MNTSATTSTTQAGPSLTVNESVPCAVRYVIEDGQTYAKLTKDDFEALLRERRSERALLKIALTLALVTSMTTAGYTYWTGYRPLTRIVAMQVGCAK